MNTITNNAVRNLSLAVAAFLMVAVAFAIAPKAQASDLFDTGWIETGYQDVWAPSYNVGYNTGWIETGYQDVWAPSYDYYIPSYGGSSYFGGYGGWTPSYFTGSGTSGGNYVSQNQAQSQSQSSTNVNNNVNNVNVNVPAAQPTVVYQQPPVYTPPAYVPPTQYYDLCYNIAGVQTTVPAGYYVQGNNCFYQQYTQPQPYVTLAAVPYTGLELGPVGTAMYWGFLVLWCLAAAYLIAVKKVQNKIAAWFTSSTPSHAHTHAPAHRHVAHAVHAPAAKPQHSGIDAFIQSQINRTK